MKRCKYKNAKREGTRSGYQGGCRCKECTAANAEYLRHWRRLNGVREQPPLMGHGTRACYARGCREPACCAANSQYSSDHRARVNGWLPRRKARKARKS